MPRLFTGLEVPREVGESLSMFRGGLPGARWIDPEFYHITLRFIGDIDDRLAVDIASLLNGMRRRRFEVRFGGVQAFGGRKPRAIVVTVEPIQPLLELQAEHERLMQRLGLEPDGRKFTPHVTLARLRDSSPYDVAEYLTTRGPVFGSSFHVSRFVLFSAKSSVGGGPYVVEADYPLAA
jgi:2'-5' RNA ligase